MYLFPANTHLDHNLPLQLKGQTVFPLPLEEIFEESFLRVQDPQTVLIQLDPLDVLQSGREKRGGIETGGEGLQERDGFVLVDVDFDRLKVF